MIRSSWLAAAPAAVAFILAPAAQAAVPAPSIAGVWWNRTPPAQLVPEDGSPPPLLPSVKRLPPETPSKEQAEALRRQCAPLGVPRVWLEPYPFMVVERSDVVAFIYESRQTYRVAYIGKAPVKIEDEDPWFFGHSSAHWEGDTLVVQTAAFNADTRLDPSLPHSDQLKVTERFRKSDDGRTLELRLLIEDPKVFARPWAARLTFERTDTRIGEYVCGVGVVQPAR